ncbi:MAG: cytochrome B5 [Nitrospirae bacterium]|nr:MAG: cytochrome B5 [Nitrospirota bacterium]
MKTGLIARILLALFCLALFPANVLSTVEYSRQTDRPCSSCHRDPSGGGFLTQNGEAYRDDLRIRGEYRMLSPLQRVIRFIIGYLHMITAIAWFGTILYVHLVLKPAYAAGGLPRGELRLGWISIGVMAVTGTLLSISRVPSWHMLFHTRFGILLFIKILLFLIMVSTAVFVTFVVGPRLRRKREAAPPGTAGEMTPARLSECDGKEGHPAYIAYKGTVYDVSDSRLWPEGIHLRRHHAGTDLTDILKDAPHGEEKLLTLPVAGRLLAEKEMPKPPHLAVFYFFAYMNLVIILGVVFVISLWRWW